MTWTIDKAHSEITFSVRHMMISNVRGQFDKFSGRIDYNEERPAETTVEVQIEAASINTRDAQRDGHLHSPDFFNVEQYPFLTFTSKRVEVVDESHARLTGDLTIRDITREVVLEVEYSGAALSPFGSYSAGFSATTKISRKEWGLTWNVGLETGGVLVGDEVIIRIDLEIIRQPEEEPALAVG